MRSLIVLLMGVVICGCEQPLAPTAPVTNAPPARDNTAINERDRDPAAKTPIDQDENTADVTITAEIRKKIVAQPNISVNGRNVKVITSQGVVTLRGPVESDAERDAIATIANDVPGVAKVDNQLEIAR
jgi:hyperosmotically inducible protein